MPPFSWTRCWSPSVLCLWRGKNKGDCRRVTGVAQRPHRGPESPAGGTGLRQPFSCSCVKLDGPPSARHHAGSKDSGHGQSREGTGRGWRPTSGRRKSRGCGSGPCTVSGTRKGSSTNCPAHFLPVNRAPFPRGGARLHSLPWPWNGASASASGPWGWGEEQADCSKTLVKQLHVYGAVSSSGK